MHFFSASRADHWVALSGSPLAYVSRRSMLPVECARWYPIGADLPGRFQTSSSVSRSSTGSRSSSSCVNECATGCRIGATPAIGPRSHGSCFGSDILPKDTAPVPLLSVLHGWATRPVVISDYPGQPPYDG